MTTKKAKPIAPQGVVPGPKPERQRDLPRLLPRCHQTWGILHYAEPVGGGLVCTTIGAHRDLFPEEYAEKLQGLIGQTAVIVRTEKDEYGCGGLDA
jgi:hypothetical protein